MDLYRARSSLRRVAGAHQVNTLRSIAAPAEPLRPGTNVRHCACVAATQLRHLGLPQSPAMGQPRRGFFMPPHESKPSSVRAPPVVPPTTPTAASASPSRTAPPPRSASRVTPRQGPAGSPARARLTCPRYGQEHIGGPGRGSRHRGLAYDWSRCGGGHILRPAILGGHCIGALSPPPGGGMAPVAAGSWYLMRCADVGALGAISVAPAERH